MSIYRSGKSRVPSLPRAFADIHSASWEGEGEQEVGVDKKTGKVLVRVDAKYFRPAEVECAVSLFFASALSAHYSIYQTPLGEPCESREETRMEAQVSI